MIVERSCVSSLAWYVYAWSYLLDWHLDHLISLLLLFVDTAFTSYFPKSKDCHLSDKRKLNDHLGDHFFWFVFYIFL